MTRSRIQSEIFVLTLLDTSTVVGRRQGDQIYRLTNRHFRDNFRRPSAPSEFLMSLARSSDLDDRMESPITSSTYQSWHAFKERRVCYFSV